MTTILLVDDEPLVLIGMQSMLDWKGLGYELVGTARNGAEALKIIEGDSPPDIVVSDIRMPVLDGLSLAEQCRERDSALPVFIMLTSYEEFDYVRRSMGVGAVEYLVKIDLTPESLSAALERARERVDKERAFREPPPAEGNIAFYRDRFFLRLYAGIFAGQEDLQEACGELDLHLDAPAYLVAIANICHKDLPPEQLMTLSAGVTRMAADVLPKYLPCHVTGMDLQHFSVLFPLQDPEDYEDTLTGVLNKADKILFNYFSTALQWAIGRPVENLLDAPKSQRTAFSALPMLGDAQPLFFCRAEAKSKLDHRASLVAEVQEYIRKNLDKRLSLNDVAAVFNFSPNYLSQLFAQKGETGFVEFVTETRIAAAKELMASSDLKIYEISEKLGFESAFYFSKVFKKLEGISPREYIQRLRA